MSIIKHAFIDGVSIGILDNAKLNDDAAVQARFASVTNKLRDEQKKRGHKELSPYVDDFLYASCIMMHAAEAALVNQETGEPIKTAAGSPATGWFEKYDSDNGKETARWVSPDGIRPVKNNNGDIFPEEELLKAHKNWIGKPLCKDHVSSSVDGIRGVIVDTYYDPRFKRVHALFALDRKNYPDLARKIEAGYATNVSMGTAVGRSVCSECQNVATVASEFCNHVKTRTHYGEINFDLNPIELSIVVTGADPRAKIRKIIASLDEYRSQANELRKIKGAPLEELTAIAEELDAVEDTLQKQESLDTAGDVDYANLKEVVAELVGVINSSEPGDETFDKASELLVSKLGVAGVERFYKYVKGDFAFKRSLRNALKSAGLSDILRDLNSLTLDDASGTTPTSSGSQDRTGESARSVRPTDPTLLSEPITNTFSRGAESGFLGTGTNTLGGLPDLSAKYVDNSIKIEAFSKEKASDEIAERITSIKNSLDSLKSCLPTQKAGVGTGDIMTFDELRKRANLRKKAYMQGTEEPKSYPAMGNANLRDDDHHLHGEELDTSVANPDQKTKEMLLRASLDERRAARAQKLRAISMETGTPVKDQSGQTAGAVVNKKFVPVAKADDGHDDMDADDMDMDADDMADDQDADDGLKTAEAALVRRLEMLKEAAKKKAKKKSSDEDKDDKKPAKGSKGAKDKDDKDMPWDKKKMSKKAYPQGTAEPESYKPMGDPDLRDDDHHLDGKVLDTKAGNPDQKVKELIQRAGLKARLTKSANVAKSRWSVLAGDKEVFSVTAADAYNVHLNKQSDVAGKTWGDLFVSAEYGKQLMSQIRAGNISKLAAELEAAKDSAAPAPAPAADAAAPVPAPAPAAEAEAPAPMVDADKGEDDMKSKLTAALEKLEECVQNLKDIVMGADKGVDNVDVDAIAATAALDRGMFEAQAELVALASELNYLVSEADLDDPAVRLAARAAIRDGHLAVIETNERIAEYCDTRDGDMYVLDEKELEEVAEEVEGAIEKHVDGEPEHEDLEDALEDLRKELAELEDKVDDLEEEVEEDDDSGHDKEDDAMDDKLAARAAMRQQLVARAAKLDGVTADPMLNIHGKGEGKLDLGMKVSDDGDQVESIFEVQEKVLATMKTAASGIAEAIRTGALKESQLDSLVAAAAVDAEAVKYYREYFGKTDSDFAKGLVSEFKKSASSTEDIGFRYKRAYAVAIDAQARNLIGQGRAALDECADTLANGSDANFDSFKRMVGSVKVAARTSGVVPQMGVVDAAESANTRTASDNSSVDVRDWRSLGKALFDI